MQEMGWVRAGAGRALTLTPAGSRLLVDVRAAWEKAQAAAEKELGRAMFAQLRRVLPSPLKGGR
jgi:DNA-binding transcriptional LysR family regulator